MKQAARKLYGEKCFYIGSRLVQVKIGLADVRDSYAILPAPLREHDKGTINYAKFEKHRRNKFRAEIISYAKRDGTSLRDLCLRFIAEHGARVLTAASAAMAAIKASGVRIDSLGANLDQKFREWYFGGVVRALRPGVHTGRFKVYDIKSAYPFAMMADHSVTKEFGWFRRPKKIMPTDFVCWTGRASGAFPFRTKTGLKWDDVRRCYKVTGWEYLAAKKAGMLEGVIKFVERPIRCDNFKKYVLRFYEQKQQAEAAGDTAGRLIAKILINSGYGKTAQKGDGWRDSIIVAPKLVIPRSSGDHWDLDSGTVEEYVDDDCKFAIWSRPSKKPPYFYNVSTGASITGCVRARLLEILSRLNAYYCDTDSVIVDGFDKIATGEKLGDWSLELEGDRLLIAGKKLYGLRILPKYVHSRRKCLEKGWQCYKGRWWKIASKGARVTPKQMEQIILGKTILFRNKAPTFSFTSPTRWIERNIRRTA